MTPPSLRETQRWLKARIVPAGQAEGPSGGPAAAPDEAWLNPQGGAPGTARLAVYAEGYLARIEEALAEVYPATRHVVGRHAFAALARNYASAIPSQDYNLSRAGRRLPEFLSTAPLAGDLPFLPDLARLEWAVAEAFHAAWHPPLDPSTLAALPAEAWPRARLSLQPAVARVASDWPILDIWEARERPVAETRIALVNRPQRVLVTRRGVAVQCELLDPPQDRLLGALMAGAPLGAACEALAASVEGDPPPVADWFARWAGAGLFTRCDIL
ncbi:MAG: putative DNA-binding domain-containing protein [Candidatus Omnitrophica bacterium]|nr:putative DNA-binding domain-containing protein [Candidatus Omnitrophota bacterium]